MKRPVVTSMDIEDMVRTREGSEELPERALGLAVIHQAIVDLTAKPLSGPQRYGAALFLTGDPKRKAHEASHADMRAFWCGLANVAPEALEARVWAKHGPMLRYVLAHPPETPSSKWRELLRRRRAARLRRARTAA